MIQIKNILIPIDFSSSSYQLFEMGYCFADQNNARLHIIHVIDPVYYKEPQTKTSDLAFIHKIRLENAKEELKKFKHISLDTARIGEQRKDLIRAYTAFKKFLVHVHLSNLHQGKKYFPPTLGILPLESFLTKLKQDKYPGAVAMKIYPKHLYAGDDEKVIEELKRAKNYFDKYYTNVEVVEEKEEEPHGDQ